MYLDPGTRLPKTWALEPPSAPKPLTRSFIVASDTVTVSGHPVIHVHVVRDRLTGDAHVAVKQHDEALRWIEQHSSPVTYWLIKPTRSRCHNLECRRWTESGGTHDGRLGWIGFCDDCVAVAVERCLVFWDRLPHRDREFFCPYCNEMRRHPDDRCPVEADGRARIKCWPCRQAQLLVRSQRRSQDHGR